MSLRVTSAVYGALRDGGQDNTEASIVKNALRERLNSTPNGVVTINNRNMGVDPAPGVLLEPICRDGHLPSLGSEREYRGLLEDAGLCVERFDDLTKQARPTWTVTIRRAGARLLRDPGARRFVRDRGQTGRGDVLALLRIPVAFRTSALRHGLFVATRSGDGCAPGTVHGTWVG